MTDVLKQLFIGGAWVDAADGATMPVDDPATGEIIAHVADAGPKDARLAEDAAVEAQEEWARTAPRARSEILRRAHEIILARTDELALLMTTEMGKPLAEVSAARWRTRRSSSAGSPRRRYGSRAATAPCPTAATACCSPAARSAPVC